jgi:hypothetical protein
VGDDKTGYVVSANVRSIKGKSAQIALNDNLAEKSIKVTTFGRGDPTTAAAERDAYVLAVLQGKHKLLDNNPWIQNIWLLDDEPTWPEGFFAPAPSPDPVLTESPLFPLNSSQRSAVDHMLSRSPENCITIVQGLAFTLSCTPKHLFILDRPPGHREDERHHGLC